MGVCRPKNLRMPFIHSATSEFMQTVKRINEILSGVIPVGFEYNVLQILHDSNISEHCDSNEHATESLIVSFGTFSGGYFVLDGIELNTWRNPIIIDGTKPHYVSDFVGERWSIALYSHNLTNKLSSQQLKTLRDCGFSTF